MSIRYKALRRQRYYANCWQCPWCKGSNPRDYEGLDQCEHCGSHVHTRYDFTDKNGKLSCTEAEEPTADKCWCGEVNPYFAPLTNCGGYGIIQCHCGGDMCVCHWHGEVECFGCEDCQGHDFDDCDDPEFDEEESCH